MTTLASLRRAAEIALLDDVYWYDYADHVSPDVILSLLNERDALLGALGRIIEERRSKGRLDHPIALIAIAAVQNSEDLWHDANDPNAQDDGTP